MVVNQVWNDSFNPFKGFSTGRTNNFVPILWLDVEWRKKELFRIKQKRNFRRACTFGSDDISGCIYSVFKIPFSEIPEPEVPETWLDRIIVLSILRLLNFKLLISSSCPEDFHEDFCCIFCGDILLVYFFPSAFASTTTGSAKDMTFGRMVVSQCANGAKLREAVNSSPNVLTSAIFFLILNCLRVSVVIRRPVF